MCAHVCRFFFYCRPVKRKNGTHGEHVTPFQTQPLTN